MDNYLVQFIDKNEIKKQEMFPANSLEELKAEMEKRGNDIVAVSLNGKPIPLINVQESKVETPIGDFSDADIAKLAAQQLNAAKSGNNIPKDFPPLPSRALPPQSSTAPNQPPPNIKKEEYKYYSVGDQKFRVKLSTGRLETKQWKKLDSEYLKNKVNIGWKGTDGKIKTLDALHEEIFEHIWVVVEDE